MHDAANWEVGGTALGTASGSAGRNPLLFVDFHAMQISGCTCQLPILSMPSAGLSVPNEIRMEVQ